MWSICFLLLTLSEASLHVTFVGDVFSPVDSLLYSGILYHKDGVQSMGVAKSSEHEYVFAIDSGYTWLLLNETSLKGESLPEPDHEFTIQYKPWMVDSVEERIRVVYQNVHSCCDAISIEIFHHCMTSHNYLFFMPTDDMFALVTTIERNIEYYNQRLLRVKQMMETFLHNLKDSVRRLNPQKQLAQQSRGIIHRRHTQVFIGEDIEMLIKEGKKYSYNSFLLLKPVLEEFEFVIPHIVDVQNMYMRAVEELSVSLKDRVDYTVSVYANYSTQFTDLYKAREARYDYCRNVSDTILDKMSVWV